jgi:YidC/Oxa1 family membrane protein insertase
MLVFANYLQPLIDVAETLLKFFREDAGLSWGWSIVALTVVVRAALIPLTLKQFKSMQALQRLQPEIKKLQAKYKEDKQRLNQEMMRFYQDNKVNPLGSCLPLLFQMPVFLALFYMLRKDLRFDICPQVQEAYQKTHPGLTKPCGQHNGADFLFIPDLTSKAMGAVLVVLVLAYVGSQLASSLLMTVTADRNQRILFTLLPVFFVVFIINFPAGLLVYWITTNLWTIVQQYIVRKTVGTLRPVTAGGDGKGKGPPDGGPPSRDGPKPKGGSDRELAGVAAAQPQGKAKRAAAPPPPPRKKKKRSGRRR